MFLLNRKKENTGSAAYADKVSIVAQAMQVTGDIESDGDIRIDGMVTGNVTCKSKVVVISTGRVCGNIQAVNVDVHGSVEGNISAAEMLSLKTGCVINGDLITEKLQIEPNAVFNGNCTMGYRKTPSVVTESGLLFQN